MMKTKPSAEFIAPIILIAALAMPGCADEPDPRIDDAVRGMRPMGQILALRMTRVTSTIVEARQPTLPVPDSHARWRVDSILWYHLGPAARKIEVEVVDQKARIHGSVPSHWQANDVRDDLATLEVLRGADIRWHVERPNERRPLPETSPTGEDVPDEGAE